MQMLSQDRVNNGQCIGLLDARYLPPTHHHSRAGEDESQEQAEVKHNQGQHVENNQGKVKLSEARSTNMVQAEDAYQQRMYHRLTRLLLDFHRNQAKLEHFYKATMVVPGRMEDGGDRWGRDKPEVRDLNPDINRKYLDEYNRMEIRP